MESSYGRYISTFTIESKTQGNCLVSFLNIQFLLLDLSS
ncbi:hypothetical protein LEP1GSC088_4581 [Leptospira interrogans str. L1207]|nr:hypothetical protein LEP1GSC088_4581 [Leptospira interrogans str. L1207]